MNMTFDFEYDVQAGTALINLSVEQYKFVKNKAKETEWIRLAAPLLALSTAALRLALIVSCVVEPIIKGISNIFGAPLFDQCSLKRGLKQITVDVAKGVFTAGVICIITPIEAVCNLFGVAIAPRQHNR